MNNVFGLDIGTRNIVGTVGYRTEDEEFIVTAQYIKQHETRAMLDGQIHDIGRVGRTIAAVKAELEKQTGQPLTDVCIAAAGRVLKTVTTHVEYEYAEESVVTGEDIHTLNLLGIEKAQEELKANNDTNYKFYCVGYSVVKYYLNDEVFISLEDHKANKIGEDIIVTFLPEDVVDGLYSAVGHAGLTVANMTLEPIAAINVAIPENFRMLNIALVDVGAGTSDISITRDGSIIAYGMIPYAGDELTEVLVQHYLVDFKTAENMKLESTRAKEVVYKDIMSIEHKIPSSDIWKIVEPVVEKITTAVSDKIKELNGDKTVSACFVVGGGGKVHGFTEMLAKKLELPEERVALRGEEVLGDVEFQQDDIEKDPLLVTPIGICLNYYEQKNNFIMVKFNGERLKLYDNNRLTIVDAALQAGFPNDQLFPKRGMPINFTVNGASKIVRGEAGEAAVVTMNGQPAHINTPLEPNSEITIEPSTAGMAATYKLGQLEEFKNSTITFQINGKSVVCPKFFQVNGSLEPAEYEIKEGDVVETRNFYTVSQVAEFMDIVVDEGREILVNNRPATLETLVYENFTIDWTGDPYGVRESSFTDSTYYNNMAANEDKSSDGGNENNNTDITSGDDNTKVDNAGNEVLDNDVENNTKEMSEDSQTESNETESNETESSKVQSNKSDSNVIESNQTELNETDANEAVSNTAEINNTAISGEEPEDGVFNVHITHALEEELRAKAEAADITSEVNNPKEDTVVEKIIHVI
ncbi:MAG: cell division FtsA domain-containing protein, partial [Agathobacter sp.]|nr:cell division FtsA domain-containing protein [Agathobacter sp.]